MYYYPISDLAVIPLDNGKVLFKSDSVAIRVNGKSASFLLEHVFPLLDGTTAIDKVSKETEISEKELIQHLDSFVDHGVLRKSEIPKRKNELSAISPMFENFLESLGLSISEVSAYLKNKKIAIIGLDGIGYTIIQLLVQYGVVNFNIADCLETESNDAHILNFIKEQDLGKRRQDVLQNHLQKEHPDLNINTINELTKEELKSFVKDSDLVIGCYDKAFVASNYWINEVTNDLEIPSLYLEIKGQKCFVGPLVIPNQTACYMCYKMRSISCERDYEEAMSYEEYLNKQKTSNLLDRGFLPSNLYLTASLAVNEVIKLLLSFDLSSIKGRQLEFDVFNLSYKNHSILFKSDCPVCRKKKEKERKHYSLNELIKRNTIEGDLPSYEDILVSDRTGIITYYDLFKKDISEPNVPFIYRADVANHNFIVDPEIASNVCSGKGLTLEQAKISALGEAVERYSGAVYNPDEIEYTTFKSITSRKLHPKHLVLFDDDQYDRLEYSKFDEENTLGWAKAYSMVHKERIYVPAISVFMNYKMAYPAEYLCPVTSNGLGAGATMLQAIVSSALEVIERDAFIITWHAKLPSKRYDPMTLPMKEVVDYCKMYERRGVKLSLFKLPTDFPCHVFAAIAEQKEGDGPALVVGLGADFNAHKAAKGALIEVGQVRPGLKKRARTQEAQDRLIQLINNPQEVTALEDHDLLYASPEMKHHFDFMLDLEAHDFDLEEENLSDEDQMNRLIEHVKKIDSDLIYYNLTPPEIEKLGIYTTRVIIPDLQPIHFGADKIRLGGTRLYDVSNRLNLEKGTEADQAIDLQPHPLA